MVPAKCVWFYLVTFLHFSSGIPFKNKVICQNCHKTVNGKINVHLVPHSHDDVGWLKTFSEYYYGTGYFHDQSEAGVQYIINSVVEELAKDSTRRFIQVETAFFWKWWQEQTAEKKQLVKHLVNTGQLEIINGAWSMNDEASVHYQSTIDQFTWGFRILDKTLGKCAHPKIGWQIDPFGHSREHAALLKQFGFEGLVIGRLDYRDKEQRQKEKNLDFWWKTSEHLANPNLFTTMFPDFYVDEPGFRFDILVEDEITEANLQDKIIDFASILNKYKAYYKTSNIMMPMGSDFTYQVASKNYDNMDRLIRGFRDNEYFNVFYSTPSCYIKAVTKEIRENEIELKTKEDDFFPYASRSFEYWTGYFTSRATAKRLERMSNNILQSVNQLTTLSRINGNEYDVYTLNLRQALGIMQHHDAITGTAKQAVANDYVRLLVDGINKAQIPLTNITKDFLGKDTTTNNMPHLNFRLCLLRNVSICENSQKNSFVVVVQNPLSRTITHFVRLPVDEINFKITGPDGEESYDVFDTIHTFNYLTNTGKTSTKELVFAARDLPPLGFKLYFIEKVYEELNNYKPFEKLSDDGVFGTEDNGFAVDVKSGLLQTITIDKYTQDITQQFLYYKTQSSGAYLFNPLGNGAYEIRITETKAARGKIVDEFLQIFGKEVRQIVRVYKNTGYVEFDWLIGDLRLVGNLGKEVITRYTAKGFKNNETFYTDSNGRQMMKRILNHRNDYEYNPYEELLPVASNYYPVTSKISIKDEAKKLEIALLNDRAEGGSSLSDGKIELMLHRKLIRDDGKGVGEILDEDEFGKGLYVRGQHLLTFGNVATERKLSKEKLLEPLILLADAASHSLEELKNTLNFKFEALTKSLPDNLQILTLEPWMDSYILRLEHIFEKDEDSELSKPATIDLTGLFTQFSISHLKETNLGVNEIIDPEVKDFKITLNPMQIRTFVFTTDKNNKGGNDDVYPFDDDTNNGSKFTSTLFVVFLVLVLNCF